MATEIERKFLVTSEDWQSQATDHKVMMQGYFGTGEKASVRVRISGDSANINIKSATLEMVRREYEIPIPLADAREMIEHLCQKPIIRKTRYYIPFGQHVWEVDVFEGDNEGLVVAEIELTDPDEQFDRPDWIGEEVSLDHRYYNVCLVKNPYKNWRSS
jgi:adenylate cyclase